MITNYATLRTEVAGTAKQSWSHRSDILGKFDTYLQLAQEEMYQGVYVTGDPQGLRVRDLITTDTATLSTSVRTLAHPTGLLEYRKLQLSQTDAYYPPLQYKTPHELTVYDSAGRPNFYTITSQLEFERVADVAYTLNRVYYAKLTDLSSTQTTHAVLTRFPSIFLYGCLYQMAKWVRNRELGSDYANLFQGAINSANAEDVEIGPTPQMRYMDACV